MSNQPKDKNEQEKGDIQDSEDLKLHLLNLSLNLCFQDFRLLIIF